MDKEIKSRKIDDNLKKMFQYIVPSEYKFFEERQLEIYHLIRMGISKCFNQYCRENIKIPRQICVFREYVENFENCEYEKNIQLLNSLPENFWNK